MSEAELNVAELIAELGATSMADMGRVMGTASARFADADGKAISALSVNTSLDHQKRPAAPRGIFRLHSMPLH